MITVYLCTYSRNETHLSQHCAMINRFLSHTTCMMQWAIRPLWQNQVTGRLRVQPAQVGAGRGTLLCPHWLGAGLFGPGTREHAAALGRARPSPSAPHSTTLAAPRAAPVRGQAAAEGHSSICRQPWRHLGRDTPCMTPSRASRELTTEAWTRPKPE